MKPRITVLTLGVDDLERSLRFYRNGLDFEWNIRRGLAILNYGSVTPLFKIDTEGNPIGLSPAGSPDMRAAYDDFHLVIDVTVSKGATQYNTQYNMEGEPVFRHVGGATRASRPRR
jgi:YD repeat-containing protein